MDLNIDGPHGSEYSRQVAQAASEAVRVLNHATFPDRAPGLEWPSDVYDVLGNLSSAAAGMPQLSRQLAAWVANETAAGYVRENASYGPHGGDAQTASRSLAGHLTEAAALAARLAEVLSAARRDTAGLESTRPAPDLEDDQ